MEVLKVQRGAPVSQMKQIEIHLGPEGRPAPRPQGVGETQAGIEHGVGPAGTRIGPVLALRAE